MHEDKRDKKEDHLNYAKIILNILINNFELLNLVYLLKVLLIQFYKY